MDNIEAIQRALYPAHPELEQIRFQRGTDAYLSTGLFKPGDPRTVEACQQVVSLLFDADAVTLYRDEYLRAGGTPLEKIAEYKQQLYSLPQPETTALLMRLEQLAGDPLRELLGEPTATVFSGWGYHYYYCVAEDVCQQKDRLSRMHQAIQHHVSSEAGIARLLDATHDVGARVARIVGSWNRRASGRPKLCSVVAGDGTRRLTEADVAHLEAQLFTPMQRRPKPATASKPPTEKASTKKASTKKAPAELDWSTMKADGRTWLDIASGLGAGESYKIVCPFGGTSKGSGFIKRLGDGRCFYRSHPLDRTYWRPDDRRAQLRRNDEGKPLQTISNVYTLMEQDADLPLWFDSFRQRPMFGDQPLDTIRHQTAIRRHTQDAYGWTLKVSREDVGVAMMETAEATQRNPLEEKARSVQWDGRPRLRSWITETLGVDEPLYEVIGHRWFISVAARVCRPGCKVDTMLIFQGRQGTYKSETFKVIAGYLGEDLVLDTRLDWSNTTKSRHLLAGRLFYEDAELMSMQKASGDELKNLLSSRTDTYIPPFGRAEVSRPRTALIVGTTNDREVLTDQTGARRFWIVDTERSPYPSADLKWLRANLPQMFAEAVSLFDSGEQWWLTPEEQQLADIANAQRTEADPVIEAARLVYDANSGGLSAGFTIAEFVDAYGVRADTVRDRRLTSRAVSKALQTAGFSRGRTYRYGVQCRVYYREDVSDGDNLSGLHTLTTPSPIRSNVA